MIHREGSDFREAPKACSRRCGNPASIGARCWRKWKEDVTDVAPPNSPMAVPASVARRKTMLGMHEQVLLTGLLAAVMSDSVIGRQR